MMTRNYILILILCLQSMSIFSQQYKRNNNWAVGYDPAVKFSFSSNILKIDSFKNHNAVLNGACISDTEGKFIFYSNSFIVINDDGSLIDNGLKINCPKGQLFATTGGSRTYDQMTLILPKKGNQYYIFSTGMSDTLTTDWINTSIFPGFDVLNYSIVDMDSNNGAGKVTVKNKILLDNQQYAQTALTAVRHANNKDWWLVKSDCWHHQYQLFLVKSDTILGPYYQNIVDTSNYCSSVSQIYFSEDGTKFASSIYSTINGTNYKNYNRVDLYNFDRNLGQLTYKNYYEAPLDSTSYQWQDGKTGICFSPDNKLLYMSTFYNIFQFDLSDTNPYSATHIHGPDTTLDVFASYYILANGPDGKMY